MGEAEGREETDEAVRPRRNPSRSVSGSPENSGLAASEDESDKSTFREYAETLLIAIVLALFIRTFVVQAFKIPSGSMIPTLSIGDHILVNKFIYGVKIPKTVLGVEIPFGDTVLFPVSRPERGDVMVFRFPKDESKDFIKRIVGIPGDTVEVREKALYLNGVKQDEPYINHGADAVSKRMIPGRDDFGPVTVPENAYFMMGDNRDHSLDSRFWGFVDYSKIKGEAFLIYWSWDKDNVTFDWLSGSIRWDRLGMVIE